MAEIFMHPLRVQTVGKGKEGGKEMKGDGFLTTKIRVGFKRIKIIQLSGQV